MKLPFFKLPFALYVLDADDHVLNVTNIVTWGEFMEHGNRRVGYTEITSEIIVSTVFLGIDLRIYGDGPPILFETLVFGGPLDGDGGRYSSYDDAETGHRMMVAKARAAQGARVTSRASGGTE